jgi:hypothetical protein
MKQALNIDQNQKRQLTAAELEFEDLRREY